MRFGVCCGLGSFVAQIQDQPLSSLPRLMDTLKAAGADYVEFGVATVAPEGPEAEFEKLRRAMEHGPLRAEAFNSFIPGKQRLTGPQVDLRAVLAYCRTALRRCKALGGAVVVLGSAGARKAPDGFDHGKAEQQFIEFCRELAPLAEEIGIDIAIEPLNRKEDNLILSVAHGIRLVDAVGRARIQLLADLYHMSEEREPREILVQAGARLRHTHLADLGRVAPGFAAGGEEDFIGFFRNLRKAGYDRRCSFEGRFDDIEKQCKPLLDLLKKRWAEAAA
ncbi:MAG: sugar phosphate isomerase/epimerase family protein [Planctomycetota bacterium]